MPAAYLPMQLRGGGRDDDEVGGLAEPGVRDRIGAVEQRRARRLRRERGERERADEALRVVGEHRRDVDAGVDEPPADLDRLVGRDPAGDAEDDPRHGRPSRHAAAQAGVSAAASAAAASTSASSAARVLVGVDALVHDLAGRDLFERDRQRLARHRGDLRRHDPAETLAELVVVVVDLAGPHRRRASRA